MLDSFPSITTTIQYGLISPQTTLLSIILPILLCLILLLPYLNPTPPPPKGCRRLGLSPSQRSNLHDEYSPKYAHGAPSTATDPDTGLSAWRIKALFTYPIKSCGGVELEAADVIETGLKYDRLFCFAEFFPSSQPTTTNTSTSTNNQEENNGTWTARTLRDRDFRQLALLRPEIWIPDPSSPTYSPTNPETLSNGVLLIYYPLPPSRSPLVTLLRTLHILPSQSSFTIPLDPPPHSSTDYPLTPVKIWKDIPLAHNYSHLLPQSLKDLLTYDTTLPPHQRRQLSLFRASHIHRREIYRNAPRKEKIGFQPVTGFADAYPIHLLNMASVRDVAANCADEIPELSVRRFRANVIIQGPGKFVEDEWKRIVIGGSSEDADGVEIYTACRTIRCKLPNVDPDTGVRHPREPDRTLKRYRRIDAGDLTNACLGMQCVPAVREFTLQVNDPITVLETGEHCYIKMLAPGEKVEGV
ncbi:hypothetical protein CBS147343_4806 [Aspergillus niger]|nr:hypothetical protein CBS133816_1945 [Aspergillus niger]KAI2844281.1 hypothetical protein CBS11350_4712 [Aspergillus niger]KAI2918019.1 hypothetical protein CBS147371_4311 [Aspergillus niger]KAI2928977.1 hypothetical protein CBS147320_4235 [Aspergillus niger]KAI2942365.1 hypothetical protein CBS147322_8920 [Aspergillus niger]